MLARDIFIMSAAREAEQSAPQGWSPESRAQYVHDWVAEELAEYDAIKSGGYYPLICN